MLGATVQLATYIWQHPANSGRRVRTLARAAAWQVYKRTTGRAVDLKVFDGLTFRCYPDSHSSSLLVYASGWPDYDEMHFVRQYLRPGDGFVDVGANVGLYSMLAASLVKSNGSVEAFEPNPVACARLRENARLNGLGNLRVHEVAVSDRCGTVRFLSDQDCENRIAAHGDEGKRSVDLPCVALDDVLTPGKYALGKMDLEGAELLALRGAERLLAAARPAVWILEFNRSMHDFGTDEATLATWLAEREFDLAYYDSKRNQLCFSASPWLASTNVLAVSRRQRDEVIDRLGRTAHLQRMDH
jgi:FkbM family methyltransferase